MENRKQKILSFDLEVSPAIGWFYPPTYETRILKLEERQKLMSYAYEWVGEEPRIITSSCLADYALYEDDPENDIVLVYELHEIMSEADIILGQNSDNFDIKMANYFFIKNDLDPIPPTRFLDTKKIAKRYFRFPNNTLDMLGEELGVGGKTKIKHADIWYECFKEHDLEQWELMKEYNENDVRITTDIYMKMRGFMRQHPSVSQLSGDLEACPNCGSHDYRIKAYRNSNTSSYKQYQCCICNGYFRERLAEVTQKPRFVA